MQIGKEGGPYQEDITTAKDGEVLVVGFFGFRVMEDLEDHIVCGRKYAYPCKIE